MKQSEATHRIFIFKNESYKDNHEWTKINNKKNIYKDNDEDFKTKTQIIKLFQLVISRIKYLKNFRSSLYLQILDLVFVFPHYLLM